MEKKKNDREELVRKYFIKTPEEPKYLGNQILMGIGAVLLLMGIAARNFGAIILDILGLVLLYKGYRAFSEKRSTYKKEFADAEPKASDKEMDQWLNEYRKNIVKEAMQRLDIEHDDTSAVPLVMDGPAEDAKWGIGADKILRFDKHDILIFFLTEHHVATFQCILDVGTGLTLLDQTKEFPYKDITNLETITLNDKGRHINGLKVEVSGRQRFSLFTSGTNKISVDYLFEKSTDHTREYIFPPSDTENTIRAIRKRLKEYKDRFSGNNS